MVQSSKEQDTISLLQKDPWRMACLKAAFAVGVTDWYLAAGFVRNLIWDYLHSKTVSTPLNDVDFVYFDADNTSPREEEVIREKLIDLMPDAVWEVRNQARMHIRNAHRPYRNSEDAIAHWPELQTCVGATLNADGKIAIFAPYGLDENWNCSVRPNPQIPYPPELFVRRVNEKNWMQIWPNLIVEDSPQQMRRG